MIEAKITCLCSHIVLGEFDANLYQGDHIWVPKKEAESSKDLEQHRRTGAVRVEYLRRVEERKVGSGFLQGYQPVAPGRKRRPGLQVITSNAKQKASNPTSPFSSQEIVQSLESHHKELVGVLGQILTQMAEQHAESQKVLQSVVDTLNNLELSTPTVSLDSMPVKSKQKERHKDSSSESLFIPSQLVDFKKKIDVDSSSGSDEGLSDSVAKLKALKKKGK